MIRARLTVEEVDNKGNVVWSVTTSEGPGVLSDFSTTAASAVVSATRVANVAINAEYDRRLNFK